MARTLRCNMLCTQLWKAQRTHRKSKTQPAYDEIRIYTNHPGMDITSQELNFAHLEQEELNGTSQTRV